MLEFVSTRTKVLTGVALFAVAGAVVSGVVDYKQDAAPAPADGVAETVTPVLDAATESTADIVGN